MARLAGTLGGAVATSSWPSLEALLSIWPLPPALDQIALPLIRESPAHAVIGLHQPDERLLATLGETGARFILALDDPRAAACDIIEGGGADLGLVTRAVANCCPLMMRLAAVPGALTLSAAAAAADVGGTIAAIANHFGFRLDKRRYRMLSGGLAAEDFARPVGVDGRPAATLPEAAWRVLDGALAAYAEQFSGASEFRQLVWKRDLFMLNAEGFHRPTGLIEVAGAARTLLTGPFIQLPIGRWAARVVLGLSPEAAGNSFLIGAVSDGRQIAHTMLAPAAGGVFAADIDFSVEQLSAKGLEIPVSVAAYAAAGQLAFGWVVLQPLAMRRPDLFSETVDFASVLDL